MSDNHFKTAVEHFDSAASKYEVSTGGCTRAAARHILSLVPESAFQHDAAILDNACGTAIVSDEILRNHRSVSINAVDAAPSMIDLAKSSLQARHPSAVDNVSCAVMPGEKLEFPDKVFSASFTSFGILFFTDAPLGAREIYRTLRPGGTAIVTSWARLGYLDDALLPAQAFVRPEDPPFKVPIPPQWLNPGHVKQVMIDAGFRDVRMTKHTVYFGAPSIEELCKLLVMAMKPMFWGQWPDDEQKSIEEALQEALERNAVPFTMPDDAPGFGLPMEAIVAQCCK